jgi:hypothetical protein
MLLRDTSNWTNLEETKGLLFLVQRLEELTFPYSLDSYKSPTMSVQGLLLESLTLIRESQTLGEQNFEKAMNSLSHIIDEIRLRLKGNFIAKSVSSLNLDTLTAHKGEKEPITEVERRFKIAYAELNSQSYLHEIISNIIELGNDGKNKAKLDFLAREFSSFLQSRGVSREHMQNVLQDFFWKDNEIKSTTQFKQFCIQVYPHQHRFCVVFGVASTLAAIDAKTLRRANATIIPADLDEEIDEDISEGFYEALISFKESVGYPHLCMAFAEATDYNSAVIKARNNIEEVFNFLRVFSHKSFLDISGSALVEQNCCAGERRILQSSNNNMHFIRDMRKAKATSVLKRFSEVISLDVGHDSHKFNNAVNIHGMSLNISSPDIQLVNIWTCLETLVPAGGSGSKISHVVKNAVPIIMLGYMNRLISNLLFDVLRWSRPNFKTALSMAKIQDETDIKSKFVSLLTRNENIEALEYLLKSCGNFELLRNRVYNLSILMSDRKNTMEKITNHQQMVEWQIHRIYRTRNSIVHSGNSPEYTKYLVENAHDFFDQTLLFCLELSAWKNEFDTFLSCFDYAIEQYRSYLQSLKSDSEFPVVWQLPRYRDKSIVFGEE